MRVGARAYLLKSLLDKELLETIRAVHAGKKSISPEASYELAEHATDELLTPAEVAVLRLIAAGNANKEIAAQLSVTEETVKGRVKNILSKLGANDRTHAAMIGIRRGIIEAIAEERARKSRYSYRFWGLAGCRQSTTLIVCATTLLDLRPWRARRGFTFTPNRRWSSRDR